MLGGCLKKPLQTVDSTLPEPETELGTLLPETVLTSAAQSTDPTPRARALSFLISTNGPDAQSWARVALEDADPWVQRAGVYALAERLPSTEAKDLLEHFVGTDGDPYVRGAAGYRLASTESVVAAERLAEAWRSERELWRIAPLALAAAELGDTEAVPALQQAIRRGELALEIDFLKDLAGSGQAELLPALREGADWVESELRLPYAIALVSLGDPSGEQALRKALGSSHVQECLEALDYVSELDHPTANTLLRKARSNPSHHVRTYAALALAARTADGMDIFTEAMGDSDPEIRELAVRFAAQVAQNPNASRKSMRSGSAVVSEALSDPNASVRSEAMKATVTLGLHGQNDALHRNLRDQYEALRIEAAGALLTLDSAP